MSHDASQLTVPDAWREGVRYALQVVQHNVKLLDCHQHQIHNVRLPDVENERLRKLRDEYAKLSKVVGQPIRAYEYVHRGEVGPASSYFGNHNDLETNQQIARNLSATLVPLIAHPDFIPVPVVPLSGDALAAALNEQQRRP